MQGPFFKQVLAQSLFLRMVFSILAVLLLCTSFLLSTVQVHAQSVEAQRAFTPNSGQAGLTPHENCSYPWQDHCRWLELSWSMCAKSAYAIWDASNGSIHTATSPYPDDMQNWGCDYGGHTRFGVRTGYATLHPFWKNDTYILYYP